MNSENTSERIPLEMGWTLWPDFLFRGTGITFRFLQELQSPQLVEGYLNALKKEEDFSEEKDLLFSKSKLLGEKSSDREELKALSSMRKKLVKNKFSHSEDPRLPEEVIDDLKTLKEKRELIDQIYADLDQSFEENLLAKGFTLREIFKREELQKALIWQNPDLYEQISDGFLSSKPKGRSKDRKRERVLTNYLQRYCTKNESIGFFGPMLWGKIGTGNEAVHYEPEKKLVSENNVEFEYWALNAIASSLFFKRGELNYLFIDFSPEVSYRSPELFHLLKKVALSPLEKVICDHLNQSKRVMDIVSECHSSVSTHSLQDYGQTLGKMIQRGLLEPHIPLGHPRNAERTLTSHCKPFKGKEDTWSLLLDAKNAFLDHHQKPKDLKKNLDSLHELYRKNVSEQTRRFNGQIYSGRSLIYEDCVRSGEVCTGTPFLESISEPLTLVLYSARWLTQEVTRIFLSEVRTWIHASSKSRIPVEELVAYIRGRALFFSVANTVKNHYSKRWLSVLNASREGAGNDFRSSALKAHVEREFFASQPGFPSGRYCCPDILLAREGHRWNYILGEIHAGGNMVAVPCCQFAHPEPLNLARYMADDIPHPQYYWGPSSSLQGMRMTRDPGLRKDFRIRRKGSPSAPTDSKTIPVGDLYIERVDPAMTVRSVSQKHTIPIIGLLEDFLKIASINAYQFLPNSEHLPRIKFDQLTIQRETWTFSLNSLSFIDLEGSQQFKACLYWAKENDLPEQGFFKVGSELKPFFVDFRSPKLVDLMISTLKKEHQKGRKKLSFRFSEMLPNENQTWLKTPEGEPLYSELRFVGVDPVPFSSSH